MKALFQGLRARLNERSTYMFFVGSMGSVAVLPVPFNWIGCALLAVAALVPDGPMKPEPGE